MRRIAQQRGLTMMEALIASALLAMAASSVYLSVSSAQVQMHHAAHAQRGLRLAEELIQYVTVMPYDDPDGSSRPRPERGETSVSRFDNMDDFHGYAEAAGELKDVEGNVLPASYQVFNRSVSARYTRQRVSALGGVIPGLLVTVTAEDGEGQTWTVSRFVPEPAN